jgi:hypothetical protein
MTVPQLRVVSAPVELELELFVNDDVDSENVIVANFETVTGNLEAYEILARKPENKWLQARPRCG